MKKLICAALAAVMFTVTFTSCGGGEAAQGHTETAPATPAAPAVSEDAIRAFLMSKEGTYGWKTDADANTLDFFDDGRLPIQGPDGEATMWQGSWKLAGDQLTMTCADIKLNETVTVKIDGEKLILGSKTYTRYKPG